jgi:hypothetical protein
MTTPSDFTDALARLDAEIAAAEAHLAELRHKRTGAEAFLDYMKQSATTTVGMAGRVAKIAPVGTLDLVAPVTRSGSGPTEVVWALFRPGVVITLDEVFNEVHRRGYELTREQTRNALHYLVRKGEIEKAGTRRGFWQLRQRDTEGPSLAGEEPSAVSELSSPEGGEHSNDEAGPEGHRHDLPGRNGDYRVGASIGT